MLFRSVLIFVLIGILSYMSSLDRQEQKVIPNHYRNEKFQIQFRYPSDWEVIEEVTDSSDTLSLKIGESMKSDEYIFHYQVLATEYARCIYSDSNDDSSWLTHVIDFGDNYKDIDSEGIFRRGLSPYQDRDQYIVCMKDEDGIYLSKSFGYITYENINPNRQDHEEMLATLDRILLSIIYSGDRY